MSKLKRKIIRKPRVRNRMTIIVVIRRDFARAVFVYIYLHSVPGDLDPVILVRRRVGGNY